MFLIMIEHGEGAWGNLKRMVPRVTTEYQMGYSAIGLSSYLVHLFSIKSTQFHLCWAEAEQGSPHVSIGTSSPGRPNIRRFLSIDPTAMYFASGPNFTQVVLPKTRSNIH